MIDVVRTSPAARKGTRLTTRGSGHFRQARVVVSGNMSYTTEGDLMQVVTVEVVVLNNNVTDTLQHFIVHRTGCNGPVVGVIAVTNLVIGDYQVASRWAHFISQSRLEGLQTLAVDLDVVLKIAWIR